jgi:hypothetical protein
LRLRNFAYIAQLCIDAHGLVETAIRAEILGVFNGSASGATLAEAAYG